MLAMQENGKLLPHRFAVRRYGLLEQVLLNGMRQIAPKHDHSLAQGAQKNVFGFAGAIHGNLRHRGIIALTPTAAHGSFLGDAASPMALGQRGSDAKRLIRNGFPLRPARRGPPKIIRKKVAFITLTKVAACSRFMVIGATHDRRPSEPNL